MTPVPPAAQAAWERAQRAFAAQRLGAAAALRLLRVEADPAGDRWLLAAPDAETIEYLSRFLRRLTTTVQLESHSSVQLELVLDPAPAAPPLAVAAVPAAPPSLTTPTPTPDDPGDDTEDTEDTDDTNPIEADDDTLDRMLRQARGAEAQTEVLARFGTRNKRWRYQPLGNYEAIFWLAFLGPRAFALWSALRAWLDTPAMADTPTISLLALVATGSAGNRRLVTGYQPPPGSRAKPVLGLLPQLRDEGLADWRGDEDDREYFVLTELPLLTPRQVERLPLALQDHHRRWLTQYEILRQWQRISAASLVPPLRLGDEKVIAFRARRSA